MYNNTKGVNSKYILFENRRGEVGGSANKVGKRIKELERLYGVYHGGHGSNQYMQSTNNSDSAKAQKQLAKEMGMMSILNIILERGINAFLKSEFLNN